jgi:Holliday junction resolvase RusA-like endonuclease
MKGFEQWDENVVAAHNAKVARGATKAAPSQEPVQETFALDMKRKSYTLVLPWPPSNNHYNGQRVIIPKEEGKKPFVMYYPTEEAKAFKAKAAIIARTAGMPILKGAVAVIINYYFPTKAGDLVNRDKVLLDVLQGIAYANDRQITRKEEERFSDKDNPRVEITIQERL